MLALALGLTVEQIDNSMTRVEFLSWMEFYTLYPFDDLHRFHRPAALVAQYAGGGDMGAKLDYLAPDPRNAGLIQSDLATMRAFGFTSKG